MVNISDVKNFRTFFPPKFFPIISYQSYFLTELILDNILSVINGKQLLSSNGYEM
jgi:hypothetical protein